MNTSDAINLVYENLEGYEDLASYHDRHGTPSLLILTQHSPKIAQETARMMSQKIKDKVVVEIGAGVGFLAIEMCRYAKKVFAIEADPAWSWIFTKSLYAHKPKNLTWIFGSADELVNLIFADVAVIVTRSGKKEMEAIGKKFADEVFFPLDEIKADIGEREKSDGR